MAETIIFKIDGQGYPTLPVLDYDFSVEILDGEGTGRLATWDMFRDPNGLIKNLDMVVGLPMNASTGSDLQNLLAALDSFGTRDFRNVTFWTPSGSFTQPMYGASYKIKMLRITRNGVTYWGAIPIKFVAKGPIK